MTVSGDTLCGRIPSGFTVRVTAGTLRCTGEIPSGAVLVAAGGTVDLTSAVLPSDGSATLKADLSGYARDSETFLLPEGWSGRVTPEGSFPFGHLTFDPATGQVSAALPEPLPYTLTWMPIGDSITEGEADMGHPDRGTEDSRGGYRYRLWQLLEDSGQRVRSVGFRSGHSGTDEAADNPDWAWHCALYGGRIKTIGNSGAQWYNVESALETAGYPDVITLMLGINDLADAADDEASVREVFEAWTETVVRLSECRPGSHIVVSTLLPVVPGNAADDRYGPFNAMVRGAAETHAPPFDRANVRLADVSRWAFGDTFDPACYKPDGIHPNEAGSLRVAEAFLAAMGDVIGRIRGGTPVPVHVHNGTEGTVTVRFDRELAEVDGAQLRIAGTDVTGASTDRLLTGGELNGGDRRTVCFPVDVPFIGGSYRAEFRGTVRDTLSGLPSETELTADGRSVELLGSGAAGNVGSAYLKGFRRLVTLSIGENDNYGGNAPPDAASGDPSADGRIRRVGYYLELKRPGQPAQFVWVSMSAEAFGYDAAKVGIPTVATGMRKAVVDDLEVFGNRGNFEKETVGGQGVIEFTPYGWSASDQDGFAAEAFGGAFGWNDTLLSSGELRGCMQIARIRDGAAGTWQDPAAEMLLAYNGFHADAQTDLGIGSFSVHRNNSGSRSVPAVYDWTGFSAETGYIRYLPSAYEIRKLEIWTEPEYLEWDGADGGEWDTVGETWSRDGEPCAYTEGDRVAFRDIGGVSGISVTGGETRAPGGVLVENDLTAYTLSVPLDLAGAAPLVKAGSGHLTLGVPASRLDGAPLSRYAGGVVIEGGEVRLHTAGDAPFSRALNREASRGAALTVRAGVLDLGGARNWNGGMRTWLTDRTVTLGGGSGRAVLRNAELTLFNHTDAFPYAVVYDGGNGFSPGAELAAPVGDIGSSGADAKYTTKNFLVGDGADGVDLLVSGGFGVRPDGTESGSGLYANAHVVKLGPGNMKIAAPNRFPRLTVAEGLLTVGHDGALAGDTRVDAALDLGGCSPAVGTLSGNGRLFSETPALLTVREASAFGGEIAGAVSVRAENLLELTGRVDISGTLVLAGEGRVRLPAGSRIGGLETAEGGKILFDASRWGLLDEGFHALLSLPEGAAAPDWDSLVEIEGDIPGVVSVTPVGTTFGVTVHRSECALTVMPMGDSITHGSSTGENYRAPLLDGLYADGWNVRSAGFWENLYSEEKAAAYAPKAPGCALHNGISGQRIMTAGNRAGYLQGVGNYLDAAGYPDIITLMIGTNDAGSDPETAFGQWKALVRRIVALRPHTRIVVSPIIATRTQTEETYGQDPFRPVFNGAVRSLFDLTETTVRADGRDVPCVLGVLNAAGREAFGGDALVTLADMQAAIGYAGTDGVNPFHLDSLHPNQLGHNRMAAVWRAAIERLADRDSGLKGPLTAVAAHTPEGSRRARVTAYGWYRPQKKPCGGTPGAWDGAMLSMSVRKGAPVREHPVRPEEERRMDGIRFGRKAAFALTLAWAAIAAAESPDGPIVRDLSGVLEPVVVAQGTETVYQGHPTLVQTSDGRLLAVWSTGHGGPFTSMAESLDWGRTWSRTDERIPAAVLRDGYRNCPSVYALTDPADGRRRLWVFSQRAHTRDGEVWMPRIVSEDEGLTWRTAPPLGAEFACIMAFSSVVRLKDGSLLGVYHRSGSGAADRFPRSIWGSISRDGGQTWQRPYCILQGGERDYCEPCAFRSPDDPDELCILIREQTHRDTSRMIFSRDEGQTWSAPRPTSPQLTGDRHVCVELPDGRVAVAFRDRERGGPFDGHFVLWVGDYGTLKSGLPGGMKFRLMRSHAGWDCGYPGVAVTPEGDLICLTYIKYRPGRERHSVVSVRVPKTLFAGFPAGPEPSRDGDGPASR